jgi:hypothetical protein
MNLQVNHLLSEISKGIRGTELYCEGRLWQLA